MDKAGTEERVGVCIFGPCVTVWGQNFMVDRCRFDDDVRHNVLRCRAEILGTRKSVYFL